MDTLSSRPPVWFPEPSRLRPFWGEFMCAVGGSLLLLGSLGSAIQVSLAPRSWPAPSRTPLRAGDSQRGAEAQGSEVACSRSLVSGRDGLVSRRPAARGPSPRHLSRLGRFRHRPLRAGPRWAGPGGPACSSLFSPQRPVLGAGVASLERRAVAVLAPATGG